jgi:photosystem II stability/assembly factor-like uncharacterized protein
MEAINMKSLIATTILLILFLLNFEATAQSGWFPQTSGTAQHLDDVFFVNSSTGWIAGDYGLILKTTNSGMNWFQQISNAGNKLFSVQFINENTGWASGYAATMRKTTNAGENWLTQSIGPAWLPWKHHFVDENHGWVACEFGIIVHTTNGGADWLTQEKRNSRRSVLGPFRRHQYRLGCRGRWIDPQDDKRRNELGSAAKRDRIQTKVDFLLE